MNLFLNAINAMPAGGLLGIEVYTVDSEVWVQVSDTGCGISEGNLDKVFDPFYHDFSGGQRDRSRPVSLLLHRERAQRHH